MPSSSPDTASPSLPESAAVRPIACNECRRRHTSCTRDRPRCQRCREVSLDCIYEEGGRNITVKEQYLRDLEFKAKAYDDALAAASSQGPASVPIPARSRPPAPSAVDEDDEETVDGNALLEVFRRMDFHDAESRPSTNPRGSFKGPGHSDPFLRSIRRLPGVKYPDDVSLDLDTSFYEPGLLAPRRLSVRTHLRLPPIDTARWYYAAQYTYIGTILSFSDPQTFERDFLEAYHSPPPDLADSEACLRFAKILVILAFGQLYSINQWVDFKGPPGFEYFSHALQLLPDVHEDGSVLCVETLSLIGYFMQNMNRRDAAFLYIGMALRMAISLGLHQEIPPLPDSNHQTAISDAGREHRRRVWWSIYSLDRILCAKSGNPITIQDEDVGVHPPSPLPSEPEYCPALVLRHYTELSRILGDVNKHIFRRGAGKSSIAQLMASVKDIMLALTRWRCELPRQLCFHPARLAMSRESVSTLVHYYQCINMTARPLLFHVVKKRLLSAAASCSGNSSGSEKGKSTATNRDSWGDWKEGLSRTTVNVIEMCVDAARDSINLMSIAAQRDLVATYGYMDSEHIFSASIVLLMVCIAFPADAQNTHAMNMGLNLLRGMGERGNSYVSARYKLLDHLRSMAHHQNQAPNTASGASKTPAVPNQESMAASFAPPASPPLAASPPIQTAAAQSPYATAAADISRRSSSFGSAAYQHLDPLGQVLPASPAVTIPNTGLDQRTLVFGPIPVASGSTAYCSQSSAPANGGGVDISHMFGSAGFSPGSVGSDPYTGVPVFGVSNSSGGSVFSGEPGDFGTSFGVGGASGSSTMLFEPGLRLPDADAVEAMFFDVNMGNMTGDDYRLWEASFVDPSAYDISQLTHAAEMAVECGGGIGGGEAAVGGDGAEAGAAGAGRSGDAAADPVGQGMNMSMEL
ncbi:C6 transcription factor [Gaeumannomyces tritici R3-111a-1]|uniref:C6 transcription factor n=1 Tax=Gaeumannomyces tritici (strain R3-111a-1) TaxID=644352 RepID=J3NME5_GAET3|nr:C6 transcription factor [Gaeumannomyces tritici R3-111a-1]EJT82476.1 C6 transcription factor [Gaeumannomyces tritici R3-111a-1]